MPASAPSAAFELHAGPFKGLDLAVVSFRGREELSRPFRFDVVVTTRQDPAALEASLLGQPASLFMQLEDRPPRVVRGIVASVERIGPPSAEGDVGLRVRVVPRLWLLERRKRSRIFQDRSVQAIVDEVLDEYAIQTRWQISKPARPRAYCVQHQETDDAFVRRILAEDGIFFSFEHAAADGAATPAEGAPWREALVFSDEAAYSPIEGGAGAAAGDLVLPFRRFEAALEPDVVSAFALTRRVKSNVALLRDFDFKNPGLFPTERAAAAKADGAPATARVESTVAGLAPQALEVYEHHGDYDQPEVSEPRAQTRLEQLRRSTLVGRGESSCRRLAPGYRFVLDEADELGGAYAVTRVVHEGWTPETRVESAGGRRKVYANTFACVPADVAFRPRRPRRLYRQVAETATVVGPAGQDIHTDGQGRVKVQFHWDLDGQGDGATSCWIRVAQAWAGPGWGTQFIPRIGMEVLVTFLGGDTDRPVITGCLYNAVNPPTHALPRMATRSGIRTRTSPGPDGYNELSFEDQQGQEVVYLHAQRDLVEVVEHDHRTVVGRADEGDHAIQVAANQVLTVGADRSVTVSGHQEETILGGRTETVSQGASLRVDGLHEQWDDDSLLHNVAENHVHNVGADLATGVGGSATLSIGGDRTITVLGDDRVTVSGSMGRSVGRDYALIAGEGLTLTSASSIRLVCGESVIELHPDEIVLTSPTVTVVGAKAVCVHGEDAVLHLDKKATLVSKEVKLSGKDAEVSLTKDGVTAAAKKNVALYSKGASVVLDDDAAMDGSTVKLNCGGGSDGDYDEPDGTEASWVDLLLSRKIPKQGDPSQLEDRGVAGARYVVEASDGRKFKGVLDGEGKARVPVPKGSAKVSFPDYDKGRVKAK